MDFCVLSIIYVLLRKIETMKHLLILGFVMSSILASAQSEIKFLEAFGKQDLSSVSDLLSNNLTVCVNDNVQDVNKKTAISILSKFIEENKISKKKLLHNGKSSDKGSSYKVARITTDTGTYRVFAYSENIDSRSVIKEIRIDKM